MLQIEWALLVVSILFFLSILSGRISSGLGVPALLLFLAVGMIAGVDGMGIQFENIQVAQTIGTVSLSIILFSGGMDTKIDEIRPVIWPGIILATVGVLLTALVSGVIAWWILGMLLPSVGIGLITALLLTAIMSSTDSASVFSILRSKGLNLKNNIRPILELESGSNDPMAYILVITLIDLIKMEAAPDYGLVIVKLIMQLVIGAISGLLLGKLTVFVINRAKTCNDSLYPILVLTFCLFIFSSTYFIGGNGFLAVYIGGLVIGNSKFVHKRSSMNFFDGIAWMSQLIMFLTLGLLVRPSELVPIIIPGIIISFAMIFLSRPISVFISLLPFKKISLKDKTYISWVGLRGAVPIIFAIFPLAEEVPYARLMFNIVFLCTLISLLVQGTSLPLMAKLFGLAEAPKKENKLKEFDIDFPEDIKTIMAEIEITSSMLSSGHLLMDLQLPENTLVVLIKRDDKYIVPTGKTHMNVNDKILVITDDHETLHETYRNLNLESRL